jgi:hypothetical protein
MHKYRREGEALLCAEHDVLHIFSLTPSCIPASNGSGRKCNKHDIFTTAAEADGGAWQTSRHLATQRDTLEAGWPNLDKQNIP